MKKINIGLLLLAGALPAMAQKVKFTEFDLSNGMRVVLHEDHTAPVVVTSVMYHVGSKDEVPGHTGMAHFFEHLLFEGSKNIKKGQFMKIVSQNGGKTTPIPARTAPITLKRSPATSSKPAYGWKAKD
ncbi:insulinase family protein [Niabella sp. W65]|nr:insulinase family protein [Niabella sp. W65]MCH7361317.1 insulinase family protein [Niabella sp. W65]